MPKRKTRTKEESQSLSPPVRWAPCKHWCTYIGSKILTPNSTHLITSDSLRSTRKNWARRETQVVARLARLTGISHALSDRIVWRGWIKPWRMTRKEIRWVGHKTWAMLSVNKKAKQVGFSCQHLVRRIRIMLILLLLHKIKFHKRLG